MLSLVLSSHGFNVRTHESAEAFMNVQDLATQRLLILDVRMPGMSGLELNTRLQAQGLKLPVIFMSGECQPHETVAAQSSADALHNKLSKLSRQAKHQHLTLQQERPLGAFLHAAG